MKLTDISIRALKSPAKGAVTYFDDGLTGFGVRVSQGGTKTYVLLHGARRHRETIGRVGLIKLAEARSTAKTMLASYTLSKHRPEAISWRIALSQFLQEKEARRRNTYDAYKRHLAYFPFGDIRLTDVNLSDLQRDLDKIKKPGEKEKTYVVLRVFLNWCERRNYLDRNPIERLSVPHHSKPRARILTDEELKKIWQSAGDDTYGKIVK